MTNIYNDEYHKREKEEFDKVLSSLQHFLTLWEAQAVDEIIAEEETNDTNYSRSTIGNLCPGCGTDIDTEEEEIEDGLVGRVDYCRHCGWESDPYYV